MTDETDVKTYIAERLLERLNERCDIDGIPHFDWCPICGAGDLGIDFANHRCPEER